MKNTYFTNKKNIVSFVLAVMVVIIHNTTLSNYGISSNRGGGNT